MKLFSRKKSNTAIREDQQPSISRPRAQGHLPPTTGPRPANPSRRSIGSSAPTTPGESLTTPLYARFARADSFENLNLRAQADSRAPSFAPTQQDLDDASKQLGYDRPWARERLGSLDSGPSLSAQLGTTEPATPTIRMVSNPSNPAPTAADRKSTAETITSTTKSKRLSLDAMAAQDPFTASKMQSVLRRAPTNVKVPEPEPLPKPHRSTTAPPPAGQPNRPVPTSRAPTAPPAAAPSRSTSTPVSTPRQAPPPSRTTSSIRSVSTSNPRGGPPPPTQNYRPSLDGATSDDGMSTFSHSQAGHGPMRPMYPSLAAGVNPSSPPNAGAKRERGPPPTAGTPSAYAWRSGQSDDGHGGGNFYTGGSQTNSTGVMGLASLPSLPPGAAPPNPNPYGPVAYGASNVNAYGPSMPYGPTHPPAPAKKRTPSNPPVSRVPHPSNGTVGSRRMSVDGGAAERPLSGGPGTWGGSAIGPNPSVGQPREREREREQPRAVPTARSVQPGEIFHHPQAQAQPQAQVQPQPPSQVQPQPQAQVKPQPQAQSPQPQPQPQSQPSVKAVPSVSSSYGPTTVPKPIEHEGERGRTTSGPFRGASAEAGTASPLKAGRQFSEGLAPKLSDDRLASPRPVQERWSPMKSFEGLTGPSKTPEGRVSPIKPSASPLSIDSGSGWSGRTVGGTSSAKTLDGTGSATAGSVRTVDISVAPSRAATATPSTPVGAGSLATPVTANSLSVPRAETSPNRSSILSTSPMPPTSPSKSTAPVPPSPSKSEAPARSTVSTSPVRTRELPQPPTQSHPPISHNRPPHPRAPSSVSSYGTALAMESEAGSETGPATSRLALAGLAPINTTPVRSASPTPTSASAAPSSAMVTARMTPSTSAARSPMTIPSLPSSTPNRGLALPPRGISPTPSASTMRLDEPSESDSESQGKKRNLLVKTRKMDGASSFRSSDERSERPTSVVPPESPGPGLGLSGGEDPFARAPPTIVKTVKRGKALPTPDVTPDSNQHEGETTPRGGMPLSPPLSSDENDAFHTAASDLTRQQGQPSPITPALTDEAPAEEEMEEMENANEEEEDFEPASTTPPGSPPPPKIYPLTTHMNMPSLLAALLPHLSFRDWNAINALNSALRRQLEETRALREEVLEFWLRGVGYSRWTSPKREVLPLSLRDLNAYMRGVSIAVYRYSAIAESFLAVRAQQERTSERVPGAASKGNLVRALASSCRAYTKVILRLRDQAECMHPDGDFRSPLFRAGNAPLLRVFVPSKEGAWLSDVSVLDCEKELKRAGALGALRVGDVVWDAAVGDEGNAGRMVWDGNYLVDLDYTYSTTGELPKYINSLAFSPSYWHKVIRTSNSPLCHLDLAPYAAEIAQNLQLVQDRVQTETPQGGRHTVVRWVHRSRFHPRPGMAIPSANYPATVDRMWEGVIVVEVEGTNEGLADLQARVGHGARLFPAKTAGMEFKAVGGKSPFRLLRSMSRPGEIWMRAVREKEKLA